MYRVYEQIKKRKRLLLVLSMVAVVFILSACSTEPLGPETEGFWDGVVIYNFSRALLWISGLFGNNYGIGIIVFTTFFKAILIPLTNMQQKSMNKMNEIQPELNELRETYSGRDSSTKEKLAEEQQKLYDDAGVNPLMGCLPMVVQMPIFIGLYAAVNRTPELAEGTFLWTNLGEPDPYYILPILAGVFTLIHSVMMQMDRDSEGAAKYMSYIMPLFIVFITFRLSSALALYFTVSNAFSVVQALLFNNPFKKRKEKREEELRQEEEALRRRKALKKAKKYGRNVKK